MRAIILAAGMGNRLGQFSQGLPKAAIKIDGIPLIKRAVQFARKIGVTDVVVVGGFESKKVWQCLEGETIIALENQEYQRGNLYSLSKAKSFFSDDFVQMNVDHLYPSNVVQAIAKASAGIYALCDFDRRLFDDDMKIRIKDARSPKTRILSISKSLEDYQGGYCGAFVVKGAHFLKTYADAFLSVEKRGEEHAKVEDVFMELIRQKSPPGLLDISGRRWLEVDTPEDWANADRILKMNPGFLE